MPSSLRPIRDSALRIRVAPEEVTIDDWPLRDRPLGSSLAMTLAAGLSWLSVWASDQPAIGMVVLAALAITLWRTWLPVRYQLTSAGVVQWVFRWRQRIPWTAIRGYELRGDGVLLLADAVVTPASPLRGLYLHWGQQRDAVLAQLDYHLPHEHASVRHSTPAANG